jgi:hypothetical protein
MSDEIIKVFEQETSARNKYVYFVCGLAAALFAYIGKDYFPTHPIDLIGYLTISSLACLAISLALGMLHIIVFIQALSANKDVHVANQNLKKCNNSIFMRKTGQANYTRDLTTGCELTMEELEAELKKLTPILERENKKMKKWMRWALVTFVACHVFLGLGFILLILAKLIP